MECQEKQTKFADIAYKLLRIITNCLKKKIIFMIHMRVISL